MFAVAPSVFHQEPATDVCIRLPWSGRLASQDLNASQFRRLVRAYEVAREIGPKTVLIHDETAITWFVRVEYLDGRFDVRWNYAN